MILQAIRIFFSIIYLLLFDCCNDVYLSLLKFIWFVIYNKLKMRLFRYSLVIIHLLLISVMHINKLVVLLTPLRHMISLWNFHCTVEKQPYTLFHVEVSFLLKWHALYYFALVALFSVWFSLSVRLFSICLYIQVDCVV